MGVGAELGDGEGGGEGGLGSATAKEGVSSWVEFGGLGGGGARALSSAMAKERGTEFLVYVIIFWFLFFKVFNGFVV